MANLNLYLSTSALIISIGGGLYFFYRWLRERKRFLLLWSFGLGSLLLFKIPAIMVSAGYTIIQQSFYPFFFVTFSLYLLAYFSLMLGLVDLLGARVSRVIAWLFSTYLLVALVYFYLSFFGRYELSFAPVWGSHVLFFIPSQVLLLVMLRRIRPNSEAVPADHAGLFFTNLGVTVLLVTSLLYIYVQVWPYPREFWYLSAVSSRGISALQVASGLLLWIGFKRISQYSQPRPATTNF